MEGLRGKRGLRGKKGFALATRFAENRVSSLNLICGAPSFEKEDEEEEDLVWVTQIGLLLPNSIGEDQRGLGFPIGEVMGGEDFVSDLGCRIVAKD